MAENFPKLMTGTNHIYKKLRDNKQNKQEKTHRVVVFKLQNKNKTKTNKDKEKILKVARKITCITCGRIKIRIISDFPSGTIKTRLEWKEIFILLK